MPSQSPTSDQLDVAIVGGGMSGLYAAWRLLKAAREEGRQAKVTVYEMSDRVGGRLLTWLPEPGLRAELGGMRFFEQQQLVWGLVHQLGFDKSIVPFYVDGPNLRLLLRGLSMRADTDEPGRRYYLQDEDKKKKAGALLEEVVNAVLDENEAVLREHLGGKRPETREDWDKVKPYLRWKKGAQPGTEGARLWDLGFWNLFSEVRDAEVYKYITDAFGYYSLAANWNAAEAIQTMSLDFTSNPDYHTLYQGYEALPQALAKGVLGLQGQIVKNTRLVSFESLAKEQQRATFEGPDGARFQVESKSLVLGLPRRSLELLAPSRNFDLQGNKRLKRLIGSVTPVPAFKLFLFFQQRWWEKLGIEKGRSVCDLPIRQTYYFAPEGGNGLHGLLMASYDDARAVEYWQGLVPPESNELEGSEERWEEDRAKLHEAVIEMVQASGGLEQAEAEDLVQKPPVGIKQAPERMIDHAMEQLAKLHDIDEKEIPRPAAAAFADWGFDPYGGGWNFWNPQLDVREMMTQVKAPLGESRVYIVGDAYSGVQGWVEGALTTTELVLEKHFGLKRPSWLPSDYYLGW